MYKYYYVSFMETFTKCKLFIQCNNLIKLKKNIHDIPQTQESLRELFMTAIIYNNIPIVDYLLRTSEIDLYRFIINAMQYADENNLIHMYNFLKSKFEEMQGINIDRGHNIELYERIKCKRKEIL